MTFTDNPFSLKTPTRNVPYISNTRLSLRKRMKSGLKSALWEMPSGWWGGGWRPRLLNDATAPTQRESWCQLSPGCLIPEKFRRQASRKGPDVGTRLQRPDFWGAGF